ncbi:tudor domain-containing protein 5 isoform X3 [Alligator mississippiensis]|uniref:tudor domain-containing protein 5 isoform X3 n=1 Tax=Alligator mississippiensis TaxID=8496 RepID=UPI0028779F8C|nr:tudor domain-containing protein 5 isoform X3 [Alligator mississippiensis]
MVAASPSLVQHFTHLHSAEEQEPQPGTAAAHLPGIKGCAGPPWGRRLMRGPRLRLNGLHVCTTTPPPRSALPGGEPGPWSAPRRDRRRRELRAAPLPAHARQVPSGRPLERGARRQPLGATARAEGVGAGGRSSKRPPLYGPAGRTLCAGAERSGGTCGRSAGSATMSEQEHLMELLRKEVRSLLMAVKEGLTPAQLEQEYLSMMGKPLPLRSLGYRSTMELVLDMPDVVKIFPYRHGNVVLEAIADEDTVRIASLVARQKIKPKTRNVTRRANSFSSSFGPSLPRRGRTPPVLPAVVKSELKDLLRLSPVLLSDFDEAFSRHFGRAFQYVRYGFFSMFEVLNAASEIIAVEQTRAGSLLTLKKNPSVKQEKVLEDERVSQPKRAKKPKSASVSTPAFGKPSLELGTENLLQALKPSSEPVDAQVLNYDNRMKQLEQDFKMTLAQKGPGGTVSSELKRKLQIVVAQYPEGLFVSRLPGEFEARFKEKLSVKQLGFFNVMELVGALHDIFHVECKEGEQDWMVFDLKSKCLKDNDPSMDEVDQHDALALSLPPAAELKVSSWDSSAKETEALDMKKVSVFKVVTKVVKQNLGIEEALLNLEIMQPEIPPDAVQGKNLCGLPLLENSSLVGVFVEHIVSPNQFYIRICSKETSEMLEDTMIEMRRCYSNKTVSNRYVMPAALIQPGCLCCVRISEDKWWYRVIVHRVLSEQEVEVYYPDFGNLGTVQKSWLRLLKCCYSKLPAQAIPCSLAWVKPLEGTWTSKAVLQFQKLCSLKPLVGVVDEYVNGVLHLFLCDTSSDDDIYLHHVLRSEGLVIICRGNFPSKGFEELNPSALYIRPSLEQNAGSAGQDFHSQQQKCISTVHGTANPEIGESESHDQGSQGDQKETELLQSVAKDVGNFPLELPYLEPVTVCTDIWDENWLPLQTLKKQTNVGPDTVDTVVSSSQISRNGEQDQIQESKELLTQATKMSTAPWDV